MDISPFRLDFNKEGEGTDDINGRIWKQPKIYLWKRSISSSADSKYIVGSSKSKEFGNKGDFQKSGQSWRNMSKFERIDIKKRNQDLFNKSRNTRNRIA